MSPLRGPAFENHNTVTRWAAQPPFTRQLASEGFLVKHRHTFFVDGGVECHPRTDVGAEGKARRKGRS